jgi:hypothetical protein
MPDVILNTSVERLCAKCGYDLRGIQSARCPECGEAFDPKPFTSANIPWIRRRAIGTLRAYWETVGTVMFAPLHVGREIWDADVVDPGSAGRFRWLIISQAIACAVILAVCRMFLPGSSSVVQQLRLFAVTGIGGMISLLLFLVIATDLGSYASLIIKREALWHRAINYYSCAPLAMAPLAAVVFAMLEFLHSDSTIGLALLTLIGGWWWFSSVLMWHAVNRSVLQSVFRAIVLPITCAFLAFVSCIFGFGIGGLISFLFSLAQ